MTTLHEALQALGPSTWATDIPHNSNDALREYVTDLTKKASLVANSLPEPPPPPSPAETSTSNSSSGSNIASSSHSQPCARIRSSPHRITSNPETTPQQDQNQDQWAKPLKISQKDNPLNIPVYKLSGADGKGAWFGRRSVHEGLGYRVWKEKAAGEFEESLRINRRKVEKAKMADYAVRGIGAESVVEDVDVFGGDGKDDGGMVANVKVWCVSAMFPGPTTPRDFSVLTVTCEVGGGLEGLDGIGAGAGAGAGGQGRCWMVVSKPCVHEKIPQRDGYIRGQYESVEVVREVPISGTSANGRQAGMMESSEQVDGGQNEGANPVEWIMITRSDPGGNIPRWMVEKGTPKSICGDTVKFLNWACRDLGKSKEPDADRPNGTIHEPQGEGNEGEAEDLDESTSESDDSEWGGNGLMANAAHILNTGLERFIPQAILDYFPHTYEPPQGIPEDISVSGANASTTDKDSEATPESKQRNDDKASPERTSLSSSSDSGFATPLLNSDDPAETIQKEKKGKLTSDEKQLIKLAQKKRKYDEKLETVRSEMDSLHLSPSSDPKRISQPDVERLSNSSAKRKTESPSSATSRSESKPNLETAQKHKAASGLFRSEGKLLKQLAKIEKNQLKVAGKVEVRQRKAAEKEDKSRSRTDLDGLRREVDGLKKEVDDLRDERQKWLGLVRSMEAENTKLGAKRDGEGK